MAIFSFWGNFKRKHKKIYKFIKWSSPIIVFAVGFLFGVILSPKLFFIQYMGVLGLSNFQHTDFKEYFQDNFKVNHEYSYINNTDLIVSVKNSYVQENQVKTILEVPDFVKVSCVVLKPINDDDTCEKYTIPSGSIKQLGFNVGVGSSPKNRHRFCLITKRLTKWLWFTNKEMTCIDMAITK